MGAGEMPARAELPAPTPRSSVAVAREGSAHVDDMQATSVAERDAVVVLGEANVDAVTAGAGTDGSAPRLAALCGAADSGDATAADLASLSAARAAVRVARSRDATA